MRKGEGCQLNLPPEERRLLEMLPAELANVIKELDSTTPMPDNLRRLFPVAYVSDEEAEQGYVASTRAELSQSHAQALELLAGTARARVLDEEQMSGWMTALNDLRLVLGTVLAVTDDESWVPDGPADSEVVIYHYLTMLQAELIDAMEQWLPDPTPGADALAPEDPWGEPLGGLRWDGTPQPPPPPSSGPPGPSGSAR
ncbi:MAG: DUF2017 family protein [Acidimicrobiales bacterium]